MTGWGLGSIAAVCGAKHSLSGRTQYLWSGAAENTCTDVESALSGERLEAGDALGCAQGLVVCCEQNLDVRTDNQTAPLVKIPQG